MQTKNTLSPLLPENVVSKLLLDSLGWLKINHNIFTNIKNHSRAFKQLVHAQPLTTDDTSRKKPYFISKATGFKHKNTDLQKNEYTMIKPRLT